MRLMVAITGGRNPSIFRKLVVVTIAVLLVSLSLLGYLSLRIGQAGIRDWVIHHNSHLANLAARAVDARFNVLRDSFRALGSRLEASPDSPALQGRAMEELRVAHPLAFRTIYLLDGRGAPLVQTTSADEALQAREGSDSGGATPQLGPDGRLAEAILALREKSYYTSRISVVGSDQVPVMYLGVALNGPAGDARRMLIAELDLRDFWITIDEIAIGNRGNAFVVSAEGMIIAHHDRSYVGRPVAEELMPVTHGFEGQLTYTDPLTDRQVLASYSPAGKRSGWGVVVEQESRQAFRSLRRIAVITLAVLLAALALSTTTILLLSRSVRRPLGNLVIKTREIAETGDLGQELPLESRDEVGQLTETFNNMIRALRHKERMLRQSQRLEAVGTLAGGVAHDFNNLMQVIAGYSELLLSRIQSDDPSYRYLEQIKQAGDQAISVTGQLLAFSRNLMLQPRLLNLNDRIINMEEMLKRVIGEDIVVTRRLDSKAGMVKADPSQIDQVLMNLVLNARDAMPKGGEILFETANVELSGKEILIDASEPPAAGRYVLLSFSDTGEGMDQETLTRIFEPFFTTKEPGKGTGLGLSTVYGIIKQSGGDIRAYSEPGTGTTFRIYLPRVDEGVAPPGGEREEQKGSLGGNETILLIEDNEMVRQVVRESLTRGGYQVIEAGCGAEGADLFERQVDSIDLVLTDMVMPGMSGRDLAEKLHSLRPEVRVLFMSGFSSMKSRNGDIGEAPGAFIKKPFTSGELLEKVRQVLTDEPEELPLVD